MEALLTLIVCEIFFRIIQNNKKDAECKEYAEKNGLSGYFNHKGKYVKLR